MPYIDPNEELDPLTPPPQQQPAPQPGQPTPQPQAPLIGAPQPQPQAPSAGTYLPAGAQLDAPPDANYRGKILPISRDAQGNLNYTDTGIPLAPNSAFGTGTLKLPIDLTAGIPGSILDAMKLPGDVATGAQPTPYSGGPAQPDPALLARTANMAMTINPAAPGRGALPEVPSARALADTANTQYDAFRNSGLQVTGTGVYKTLTDLTPQLRAKGFIVDPTSELGVALRDIGNSSNGPYTISPGVYDAAGLDAARQNLSKIASGKGPQAEPAGMALNALDDYMTNLPMNPQHLAQTNTADVGAAIQNLQDARANYGAAKRSDALTGSLRDYSNTGILDQAVGKAESNAAGTANLDQLIRTRLNAFMSGPGAAQRLAGFSDAEKQALQQVASGGSVPQQALGWINGFLGAGHGAGQAGVTTGVGVIEFLSHLYENHPEIATALTAGTVAAKPLVSAVTGRLESQGLQRVDEAVRSRSPLYQSQTAPGVGPQPRPPINWSWRAGVPALLNQQNRPPLPALPQQGPIPASLLNAGWA